MPVTVSKLPDGPIILVSCQEPMDWHREFRAALEELVRLRDSLEDCPKYYAIIDVTAVTMGFSEVVFALGEVHEISKKHRPDMPVSLSLIGSGGLMELASKAMGQQQYGKYHMPLYTSLDKALEIAHADIAARSG
jgi:hypothetical protein